MGVPKAGMGAKAAGVGAGGRFGRPKTTEMGGSVFAEDGEPGQGGSPIPRGWAGGSGRGIPRAAEPRAARVALTQRGRATSGRSGLGFRGGGEATRESRPGTAGTGGGFPLAEEPSGRVTPIPRGWAGTRGTVSRVAPISRVRAGGFLVAE